MPKLPIDTDGFPLSLKSDKEKEAFVDIPKTDCNFWQKFVSFTNQNFQLIKDICNQLASLGSDSSFIVLFPRMDFKGLGFIPQLFFIHPKHDLVISNITANTSDKPVLDIWNRNAKYASYNVITQPQTISLNNGILTSIPSLAISYLKRINLFQQALTFEANLIKEQLKERVLSGVYFSIYSPSFGLHELSVITSLTTNNTPYIDEVEISLQIKIVKSFNIKDRSSC